MLFFSNMKCFLLFFFAPGRVSSPSLIILKKVNKSHNTVRQWSFTREAVNTKAKGCFYGPSLTRLTQTLSHTDTHKHIVWHCESMCRLSLNYCAWDWSCDLEMVCIKLNFYHPNILSFLWFLTLWSHFKIDFFLCRCFFIYSTALWLEKIDAVKLLWLEKTQLPFLMLSAIILVWTVSFHVDQNTIFY